MSIVIKGVPKVTKMLSRIKSEVVNQAIPLKQSGVLLLNEINGYFAQGGNPSDGGAWIPNRPATIAAKGSSRVLVDTGVLRGSFGIDATGNTLRIGTKVNYAEFHQEGNGVPRRPMLPSDIKVLDVLEKQYTNYIAKIEK